jgi:hypothetical protein
VANENSVPPKPPINGAAANTSRMNSVDQSTLAPSASSGAPPIRHRGRSPTVGKANTGNLADWATSRGGACSIPEKTIVPETYCKRATPDRRARTLLHHIGCSSVYPLAISAAAQGPPLLGFVAENLGIRFFTGQSSPSWWRPCSPPGHLGLKRTRTVSMSQISFCWAPHQLG